MPATKESRKYVDKELPYRLLAEIHKDSRRSMKELGRSLGISHHTVSRTLEKLEEKYGLAYTLDFDPGKLGFSEGRIITIKFEERPGLDFLKQRFEKDIFVQDVYSAEGDFDLLLYVIGLTPTEFAAWQWKLRIDLKKYKPLLKISTADNFVIGFLPLRNQLIEMSDKLSGVEKKILTELNENSRIKLNELIKRSKTTQMKVIYAMKKFKKEGIIKKYTALVQNPTKRIFLAFTILFSPNENHSKLRSVFLKELVKEDLHSATSDYSVILDTVGAYDSIYICTFDSGEGLSRIGPDMQKSVFSDEAPKIDRAVLTGVITGKWPFHLDDYGYFKKSGGE